MQISQLEIPAASAQGASKRRPVKGLAALIALIVVASFLVILSLNMAIAQGSFTVALLEE